jgi:predicted aspartyl protease
MRLRVVDRDDDLLVIIDTAFTGELLLQHGDAVEFGVLILDVEAAIELGDGSVGRVKQGLITIDWLGRSMDATVQVSPMPQNPSVQLRREGAPVGLLGTALLKTVVLSIDFPKSEVVLRSEP